ncbi:hypothetical protein LQ318_05250 [Aliifodinibius salicampi]|uniref:DUF4198 domain-containing protein n=1 Tax=Fodinibius salicampi TaxID=1920655 RepID=A0ABT3PWS6_9BACT|nr:hypothetical protein [Fodinibius salicampi]MCW9712309.1 hypothetical protein [Fodinibius salicampi]
MKIKTSFLFFLLVGCVTATSLSQQSTTVVVRAIAKDAKFIGTSMDGASILIEEADSGVILAEGKTEGTTGDTQRLVREPHKRYGDLHTEGAAKFEAQLDLSEPTLVKVSATAPKSQRQSSVTTSTELWLIPGKDITGDGIVLEIPGFSIDILQPQAHERNPNETVTITANAVMMCGCPIEPGGLWDSDEMEFVAVIEKGGEEVERKRMEFAGKQNTFEASFAPEENGPYQILVYGYDPRTGNTGVDRTTFIKQ